LQGVLFQSIGKKDFKHDVNVNVIDYDKKEIIQEGSIGNIEIFVDGSDQDKEFFQEINAKDFQIFKQNSGHPNDFGQDFANVNVFKVQFIMI
jgi:hypothetical protein